ncbi:hypothetical protein HAT86_12640 [Roseovarius gahaiensis]|uniref:Uncharacterized protein n=1 Tax=Roseovarius gahaiensis TaxID=2716691 RepID=A0A967EFE9_9RHOB|nr:hypothetical protein [Roseovarius gahaiensis]NHQ75303.1 hypothetical protein [Roseovarius gahaiensis]
MMPMTFPYSRILLFTAITVGLMTLLSAWPTAAAAHPSVSHMSDSAQQGMEDAQTAPASESCCHHDGTCTSKVTLSIHHAPAPLRETSAGYPIFADPYRTSLSSVADPPPPRI